MGFSPPSPWSVHQGGGDVERKSWGGFSRDLYQPCAGGLRSLPRPTIFYERMAAYITVGFASSLFSLPAVSVAWLSVLEFSFPAAPRLPPPRRPLNSIPQHFPRRDDPAATRSNNIQKPRRSRSSENAALVECFTLFLFIFHSSLLPPPSKPPPPPLLHQRMLYDRREKKKRRVRRE